MSDLRNNTISGSRKAPKSSSFSSLGSCSVANDKKRRFDAIFTVDGMVDVSQP